MTFRGYVKDGSVVLAEPIPLPDGTEVKVEPVAPARRMTLAERFKDVVGSVPDLPSAEKERLAKHRDQIAQELPDLIARDQMRKDAREENTLSGELQSAIHESTLSLAEIAAQAGITPVVLDDFLTGERTLRSDVIDRLTSVLGYELSRAK
jgi:hypothetical protein